MRTSGFRRPPAALRRATLDNLALVSGSMLPYIEQWQEMANELPRGGVLIVLPDGNVAQKSLLLAIAKLLARDGHQVRVVPETEMTRRGHLVQGRLPFSSETRRR